MIDVLLAAGGQPYTEYPFGTHGSSFHDTCSERESYEWIYALVCPKLALDCRQMLSSSLTIGRCLSRAACNLGEGNVFQGNKKSRQRALAARPRLVH